MLTSCGCVRSHVRKGRGKRIEENRHPVGFVYFESILWCVIGLVIELVIEWERQVNSVSQKRRWLAPPLHKALFAIL
jgi:hypothetical protein